MKEFVPFLVTFGTSFILLVLWVVIGLRTAGSNDPHMQQRHRQCARNYDEALEAFQRADADRRHLMLPPLADAAEDMAAVWCEMGAHCGPAVYAVACMHMLEAWMLRILIPKK